MDVHRLIIFLPKYHFYFLSTQINNEHLALYFTQAINNSILTEKTNASLKIYPTGTVCIFTSCFFFKSGILRGERS